MSIAAGIVITRVSTGDKRDTQLAHQIGEQLMAHPRALIIAGLAVASFLVVPGFPKWVFGLLAAILLGLGFTMRTLRQRRRTPGWISHREGVASEESDSDHAIAAPLAVRLSSDLRGAVDRYALDQHLAGVKTAVESDLGPVFPRLQLAYADGLPEHGYQVLVHDVAVSQGVLKPGWLLLDPAQRAIAAGRRRSRRALRPVRARGVGARRPAPASRPGTTRRSWACTWTTRCGTTCAS